MDWPLALLGSVILTVSATIFVVVARMAIAIAKALEPWIKPLPDDRLEKIRQSIEASDLATIQQNYLLDIYLPSLVKYRSDSWKSGTRFRRLAKRGIFYPAIGGITTTMIAAVPKDYWIVGLVVVGIFSAIGFIATSFDSIERNNDLCRDNKRVADAMENSLRQLLTENLEIPIADRWQQFCAELEAIQEMEAELFERRLKLAQTAASTEAVAAQERLQQSRKDYRANAAPQTRTSRTGTQEVEVSFRTATSTSTTAIAPPARTPQSPEQIEINRQQAKAAVAMLKDTNPIGTRGW